MVVKKSPGTKTGEKRSSAKKTPSKAAKKSAGSAAERYTDPTLRDRIKEEITAGDKGGNPGQWSARKAQMVAHEYEAQGGRYKTGPDEEQQSLKDWGDEHWTTRDGKPAKQEDGMHRYLPSEAWEKLSPAEQAATDKKKLKGSEAGKQFVDNTGAAKSARRRSVKHDG